MGFDPNKPLINAADEQAKSQLIEPDEPTKERIANLAIVGEAINETYSEENQDQGTDFYLAKEGLERFKQGIIKLNLDPRSRKGMLDLIEYLEKKMDKRLKESGHVFT